MTNTELALEVVANVKEGTEKLEELKTAVQVYIDWAAKQNKSTFEQMHDESTFFGVCKGLGNIALPDKTLVEAIKKQAPFWVKPFVGTIVSQSKMPLFGAIISLLDTHLLDKRLGPDWYIRLRELAIRA